MKNGGSFPSVITCIGVCEESPSAKTSISMNFCTFEVNEDKYKGRAITDTKHHAKWNCHKFWNHQLCFSPFSESNSWISAYMIWVLHDSLGGILQYICHQWKINKWKFDLTKSESIFLWHNIWVASNPNMQFFLAVQYNNVLCSQISLCIVVYLFHLNMQQTKSLNGILNELQ